MLTKIDKKMVMRSLLVLLYIIPLFFSFNYFGSIIKSNKYPTNNIDDIIRARDEGDIIFSTIEYVDAPVNIKQTIDATIISLNEVTINHILEIYVFGCFPFQGIWENHLLYKFQQVSDLEVSIDDERIDYYVVEQEGEKYYYVEGFNMTECNKIYKLEYSFKIDRTEISSKLTKIPWGFNKNYSMIVHLPVLQLPISRGNVSDISSISIENSIPFRQILMAQSGWVDLYLPPENEWKKYVAQTNPNVFLLPRFEFPINQTKSKDGGTYTFSTYFSENNIASRISIVIIPQLRIILLPLVFLYSCFYIPFIEWFNKRKKKDMTDDEKSNVKTILKIYSGPLFSLIILLLGGESLLNVIPNFLSITNRYFIIFVSVYPLLFYYFYNKK